MSPRGVLSTTVVTTRCNGLALVKTPVIFAEKCCGTCFRSLLFPVGLLFGAVSDLVVTLCLPTL